MDNYELVEVQHQIDWSDSDDSHDKLAQSKETRCIYCYKILTHLQIPKHEENCEVAIQCTARKVTCKDGSLKFICDICCRTYKYAHSLAEHEKRHEPPGGFICRYCDTRCCNELQLEQHTENTHKVYKCKICKETFDIAINYVEHIKMIHNGQDKLYHVCEDCGRQFSSLNVLKFHKETKCGTLRPFKCDKCTKTFKTKYLLKAHDLLHLEGKQYCCSFCGNKFATKAALQRHERKHTGERPFKCELCGKTFAYGESLVTHSSVHTGIKPYLCECCGSRFSCTGNLLAHRRKRPGTCGQPQYCTKLAKACPRPSIKTNEKSKSLIIKAQKVLKDYEANHKMKKIQLKKIRIPSTTIFKKSKVQVNQLDISQPNLITDLKLEEEKPFSDDWKIHLNDIEDSSTLAANSSIENLKLEILENEFLTKKTTINSDSIQETISEVNTDENLHFGIENISTNTLNSEEISDENLLKLHTEQKSSDIVNNDDDTPKSSFTGATCNKAYKTLKAFKAHAPVHDYASNKRTQKSKNDKLAKTKIQNISTRSSKNLHKTADDPPNTTYLRKSDSNNVANSTNNLEQNNPDDVRDESDDNAQTLKNSLTINFHCIDCPNQIFHTKTSYIKHLRQIHQKNTLDIQNILLNDNDNHEISSDEILPDLLQCKICGKHFTLNKTLQKHLKLHDQESDNNLVEMCQICNIYFSSLAELEIHAKLNHDKTCTTCHKVYENNELLQGHKCCSSHPEDSNMKPKKYTFICNKCGRTLSSRTALTNHELSDCGKDPIHKCHVCKKGLHSAGSLKSHMLIHSGSLMFKCKYCERRFARKGQCQIHERKHTGEKPFPCTYCDKAFAYRENLLIHISIHTGLKRYMCNSCGERFSCVTGLKAHWRTHSTTCGLDPNRSTKASGIYLGFQKGQLVHTKEPTEATD